MSDEFSEKQGIDKDFITHFSKSHATDFDDGELLGDLLNEVTEPEQAADPLPSKEGNKSTFLLPAITLILLAGGVIYAFINSDKADQKSVETITNHETPAAAITHQNKIVIEKPVIQQNKAAVIEPVVRMQIINKPEPKPEPAVEQPSSAVKVNSELDSETVKRTGPPWALNLVSITNKQDADKHLSKLKSAGYAAEVVEVTIKGTDWYRIRIPGFASVREANLIAAEIVEQNIYPDTWVGGQ